MTTGPDPLLQERRGLGAAASWAAAVTVGAQGVRLLLQIAGILVLARLLAPADYGLVAVVAVLVGFGELLRDSGLSSAAVQAKVLSTGQRDNLFWLNTGAGLLLTVLLCAAAPLVALGFGNDRLAPVTVALSATFLLNGVATQYRAMLARQLRFGALAASDITGQAAGLGLGIVMAALGAGFWALVAQQLVQGTVALCLLLVSSRWLPGRIDRTASIRPLLRYGLPLLGAHLLNYLTGNVDTLTIGARFGAVSVGLYDRAFQLVRMPLLQLQAPSTRVALPVLAQLQSQDRRFAEFVSFGQRALLTVIGSLFAVLFAQASAAVFVVLGPRWMPVVPIVRVLLIAGFFQAATYAVYWVFLAKGLTRSQFRYALVTRPLMAGMVVAGSIWGVNGVAVAYAIASALSWAAALLWIRPAVGALTGTMFGNACRSGLVFSLACTCSFLSTRALPAGADGVRLGLGSLVVIGAVAVSAAVWPSFRQDLGGVATLLGLLTGRRRNSPAGRPAAMPAAEALPDAGRVPVPAGPGRRSANPAGEGDQ